MGTGIPFASIIHDPSDVLQLIREALPEETSLFGGIPALEYTYLPASHAKALSPDSMLVVGIRGAGKSFWFSALQQEAHRSLISKNLSRAGIDKNTIVSQGFGEGLSLENYPGKDHLAKLLKKFDARQIWRTIALTQIVKHGEKNSLLLKQKDWTDKIDWVLNNPEQVEKLFIEIDNKLDKSGTYHLVLFDAIDRTASDWNSMYKLVSGLLQVLLEFRSFKRLRLKAFVRPDHIEDSSVTAFPDSSKVLSSKVELSWPRHELYGLLWQHLGNELNYGELFRTWTSHIVHSGLFSSKWSQQENVWIVPDRLRLDEALQKEVFHAITGPYMGRDHRRGFPYSWLPSHLSDALRQVSPRSFLAALHHAAMDNPRAEYNYALHYESIKRGVQEASKIRVREMQEDYYWVGYLMKPLAGITVPCPFEQIQEKWEQYGTLNTLKRPDTDKSAPAHISGGAIGIRQDLEELGVFERMQDGRVNLPDVYRVGYGIGRRGGVKAVARG